MRKVLLSAHMTLDGYMAGPNKELDWHFNNWNDEMEKYIGEQKKSIDTILVGRVTYLNMAKHWPSVETDLYARTRDIEFAKWMNSTSKIVFSKSLKNAEWNNSRVVNENISEEIARLKRQPGKDMIMWDGIKIVSSFIKSGLFDEYQIWVAPVVLGTGFPLFKDIRKSINLELLNITQFSNGVVLHNYRPKY